MKGANPGQGKKLTSTPGGSKFKRYSQAIADLPKGQKTTGGTSGGDNTKAKCGYDKGSY
jgi:hypothetical protein